MSLRVWERGKPQWKHELTPVKVERHQRRKAKAEALVDAYAKVDKRDHGSCWVTGRVLSPSAVEPAHRREHHHLKGRRVEPSWVTKPERIITVSALAHDLITRGWIVVEGTDARKPIFFHWASFVKPEQKVLVIKRRTVRPVEADE